MMDILSKRGGMDRQASSKIVCELISKAIISSTSTRFSPSALADQQGVLEAIDDEGLFEAARLANPQLPQCHPKLLIEMLNSGKTRRVKAILLHVLKTLKAHHVSASATGGGNDGRARKLSLTSTAESDDAFSLRGDDRRGSLGRRDSFVGGLQRKSSVIGGGVEPERLEYEELESVVPLPLHAIFAADQSNEAPKNVPSVFYFPF
jgi:hypothetical protein